MDVIGIARAFATERHAGQEYGGSPYTVHLEAVAREAKVYDLPLDVVVAAWLHDTLEDTVTTYDELVMLFGKSTARLVESVTDEPGKNRKERASTTLPKIRKRGTHAVALKLCDRIANVRTCVDGVGNVKLLKMYRKEYSDFRMVLYRAGELSEMWHNLDRLIGWNSILGDQSIELAKQLEKLAQSALFYERVGPGHLEEAARHLRWLQAVIDQMRDVDRIHAEDEVNKRDADATGSVSDF